MWFLSVYACVYVRMCVGKKKRKKKERKDENQWWYVCSIFSFLYMYIDDILLAISWNVFVSFFCSLLLLLRLERHKLVQSISCAFVTKEEHLRLFINMVRFDHSLLRFIGYASLIFFLLILCLVFFSLFRQLNIRCQDQISNNDSFDHLVNYSTENVINSNDQIKYI